MQLAGRGKVFILTLTAIIALVVVPEALGHGDSRLKARRPYVLTPGEHSDVEARFSGVFRTEVNHNELILKVCPQRKDGGDWVTLWSACKAATKNSAHRIVVKTYVACKGAPDAYRTWASARAVNAARRIMHRHTERSTGRWC